MSPPPLHIFSSSFSFLPPSLFPPPFPSYCPWCPVLPSLPHRRGRCRVLHQKLLAICGGHLLPTEMMPRAELKRMTFYSASCLMWRIPKLSSSPPSLHILVLFPVSDLIPASAPVPVPVSVRFLRSLGPGYPLGIMRTDRKHCALRTALMGARERHSLSAQIMQVCDLHFLYITDSTSIIHSNIRGCQSCTS